MSEFDPENVERWTPQDVSSADMVEVVDARDYDSLLKLYREALAEIDALREEIVS